MGGQLDPASLMEKLRTQRSAIEVRIVLRLSASISLASCLYHMFPEKPMDPLTVKELIEYKRSTKCHICFNPIQAGGGHIVFSGFFFAVLKRLAVG